MTDDILSKEDKALFRSCMRSVTPLTEKKKKLSHKQILPPQGKHLATRHDLPLTGKPSHPYLSDFLRITVGSDTVLSFAQRAFSSQRLSDLKVGKISWQARLDLHGLNVEQARDQLGNFILNRKKEGVRCLLIIHGKGSLKGEPPVLKNLINCWLPQFKDVLAFHSARPKDGGSGAVYVLLKKI